MAARMFSEDQLEQLRSFPDIDKDDLIRQRRCYQRKHVGVVPSPHHQVRKIRRHSRRQESELLEIMCHLLRWPVA
jgi:hypothetical protein